MLQILFALTVIVERLTEHVFGTPFEKIPKLEPWSWVLKYIALAVGVLVTLQFNLDLLTEVGLANTTLGEVLTGVAVGGGSSLLHELISGIRGKPK